MLLALLLTLAADTVRYSVAFPNAVHHEARVEVEFPAAGRDTLEVWMSRSSPGRYALHEFAKNVYDVRATDRRGRDLAVVRRDPYRWLVVARGGPVRFAYTLFADRADGTYSQIDRTHAHLNMPATFAWARGLERRPVVLRVHPPAGSGWRAATQLLPTGDSTVWAAPDLAYFLDSPTELSAFDLRTWTVTGPGGRTDTIRLAVHHDGTPAELDAYAEAARRVVAEQVAIFGETARFDHGGYTFIADYLPWVSGDGMEHRNSTVITSSSRLADAASRLLVTLSHEFFHSWNVERIRPADLEPFDFTQADPTTTLWFGEGFTNYYDRLAIRRAELMSDSAFAAVLTSVVNAVTLSPARRFFGPMGMSLQAPFTDAATSIDPTSQPNTFLSYYTYGAGVALALDLRLRAGGEGRSLDGFMRLMWERFGRTARRYAIRRPYTAADLERTLGEYSGDPAFAREFFRRHVSGREAPDYAALLAPAGFLLRAARPDSGYAGELVLEGADSAGGARVASPTLAGTPVYEAGLGTGDVVRALDGVPMRSQADWDAVLARHAPGDEVPLRYRQRGHEVEVLLRLIPDPRVTVVPVDAAGDTLDAGERAFREAWLGSRAPGAGR